MPKTNEVPSEIRVREGKAVAAFFAAAQAKDESLTQISLALEMDVTQGMINKWFSGRSSIAVHRLLYLAKRLEFDPVLVRPSLTNPTNLELVSETEKMVLDLFRRDQYFRNYVEAMAKATPAMVA